MGNKSPLREDARGIWQAGVAAVAADQLVRQVIRRDEDAILIRGHRFTISSLGRIAVVGAGKAGAGMAVAVEEALGPELVAEKVTGWVNVPADCLRPTAKIHLHAARPAGENEPTRDGVAGGEKILEMVADLTADDLCLVLISGGGSALLPAPIPPVSLEDKQAVTRLLMQRGATISQLNAVRKRLSRIKGGGLARSSRAGQLLSLIISDVVGDPLDVIASGPTYPDATTDREALDVLRNFIATPADVPQRVIDFLNAAAAQNEREPPFPDNVANHIIGNNAMALAAAAAEAERRGYEVVSLGSENGGEVNDEGRKLARRCREYRDDPESRRPVCILSGGEPIVRLTKTDQPRKGGRNQQLVLASLEELKYDPFDRIAILSGGTDGEDGPTAAAGAWADAEIVQEVKRQGLNMTTFLEINDSYSFFERVGGLLVTGPTHTNVMDLRVALIAK